MSHVNLIPAARRAKQLAARRHAAWGYALRVYAILLAVPCALTLVPASADAPSLDSSIARVDRRVESRTKDFDALRLETALLNKKLNIARSVGEHPDWSALLATIARSASNLAVIESLDLSITKEPYSDKPPAGSSPTPPPRHAPRDIITFKLTGLAASPAGCIKFASALEKLNLFDRVLVKDTHPHELGHMPATHFDIEATCFASSTTAQPASTTP